MRLLQSGSKRGGALHQALALSLVSAPRSLVFVREPAQLDQYAEAWDRLAARASRFYRCYLDCRAEFERQQFLAAIEIEDGQARGVACFVHRATRQEFTIGERRLLSLPATETALFGGEVLGDFGADSLAHVLRAASREWRSDLFTLGEIATSSSLCHLAATMGPGLVRTRRVRKDPIRWLIPLPRTFDEYLGQLRGSTRKSISYSLRRFERELDFRHEIVTRPEQVGRFLLDGERISRRTYQWNVGQRLVDDEATRRRFMRLAEEQRLRCHIVYINGEPCAFTRGEISNRIYHYETPGFLPNFRKYSPGVVLLMWTIRDLIDSRSCDMLDFGSGGDSDGYKSRFGTLAVPCTDLQFAFSWRPYSLALLALNGALTVAKNVASAAIGKGPLRQRLKKRIRNYSPSALS